MKKRILSILLAALMLVSLLPLTALAVEYTDTKGHWGERAIDRWSDYGVVSGKGDGVFDPDGLMKRGEAAQVFANLFRLTAKGDLSDYIDVGLGKWYDDAIAKCVKAGILSGKGEGVMDPEGTITREEFFTMFARALGIEPETAAKIAVADGAQAASWAAGYITALVNRGYVKGTGEADGGVTVRPKLNINRASVMSLMDQTIDTYVNTTEKVTAGDGLTLIVVDNANVTFAKGTESAEVYVFGKNAAVTNAPVGTVVTTSEDATGTRVNGKAFSTGSATTVEQAKPSSGGGGSYTPPAPPAPTTCTVTFDMQGHGTQIDPITNVVSDAKITAPSVPTATGYAFKGWYKEAECTNEWVFDTDTVKADTTLYAKWVEAKTLGELLPDDFPDYGDWGYIEEDKIPEKAWTNNDGFVIFKGNCTYDSGPAIVVVDKTAGYNILPAPYLSNELTQNENSWVIDCIDAVSGAFYATYSFNMENDKLVSITVSGSTMYGDNENGTYTAPAPTFSTVADILATVDGFPSGEWSAPDNAWKNLNGLKLFKSTAMEELSANESAGVGLTQSVTKSGANWTCNSSGTTFTFNMTSGVLTSVTVSGSRNADGTYYAERETLHESVCVIGDGSY